MSRTWGLIGVGTIFALIALFLVSQGNPPNMGVCVACFLRDTAGGLQLQTAAPVQYMRPEIFGFAIGSLIMALAFKEFRPRSGSAPMVRFTLGFLMMLGCLVFLGCPLRLFLRLGAGDLNAAVGFVGLAVGIVIGTLFLKKDFQLTPNQEQSRAEGFIFPAIIIALLALVLFKSDLFAASKAGPASLHAPIAYALGGGIIFGALVQRTGFCSIGFISHIILFKRFYMFFGVMALILVTFAGSVYLGKFKLGFEGQPIAHTDGLWNFLSMTLVGICGVFLSGCPLR
ncbi:MAG: YedE family putative selenium transporter, partial [Saezia sp.]